MRQLLVVALTALVLLGSAGRSEAGLGDLIWEMSGPQMFGVGIACRYKLRGEFGRQFQYCELSVSVPLALATAKEEPPEVARWSVERVFWSWGAAGYVSTGWNDPKYEDNFSCPPENTPCEGDKIDYRAFDHRMISFEPTLDYALGDLCDDCRPIFVSTGVTLHSVWNRDADQFWKAGFKVAQVEVPIGKRVKASASVRLYPDGFGADQFGKGSFAGGDRPHEWTWGVGASFPLFRKGS